MSELIHLDIVQRKCMYIFSQAEISLSTKAKKYTENRQLYENING